ncbi:MAG: type I-F CRISPR-associated protein Csy1 [Zetaproteobacteria bacterium]|nr:type I-F CRISPR-associated protein Csy1 [Zetaproteobacteria bacterium]
MLDKAIAEFLESKKQDFLKKKNKGNVSDEDKQSFILESENKYSLENWLIDASKRAKQLSLTSHPAKFVHPNAKTSSVIAHAKQENDGLLRSGNVDVQLDIFGNAAALDVEKFLRVRLQDGKTVLQHLEENTGVIQEQFTIEGIDYKKVRDDFMRVKSSDLNQTSEKIKQVYFPVGNAYHLLSILNSSGIIYKLKSEVNGLRFSEENKQLREALKKANPQPMQGTISDLYGLVALGYGGTKPQNISTLNNQNGGVSLLLPSLPPNLSKRKVQPPKKDFFDSCLWDGLFQSDFEAFHEVLTWRKNNKKIRDKRDDIVLNAIAKVKRLIESIRDIHVGWSDSETYNGLLRWQKIWLDEQYADIRHDKSLNDDYLTKAQSYFSNWFINHYKSVIKDSKLLGDDDIQHVKKVLNDEQVLLK